MAPVTMGAAMDVPDFVVVAVSLAIPAAVMAVPGAHRLIQAPVLLVVAGVLPCTAFPTEMTPGRRPGERLHESPPWLPPATIKMTPASTTSWAAMSATSKVPPF